MSVKGKDLSWYSWSELRVLWTLSEVRMMNFTDIEWFTYGQQNIVLCVKDGQSQIEGCVCMFVEGKLSTCFILSHTNVL